MEVAIRVAIELNDDKIKPDDFLKEFRKTFDDKYFVKECEYEHGENEQGKREAL